MPSDARLESQNSKGEVDLHSYGPHHAQEKLSELYAVAGLVVSVILGLALMAAGVVLAFAQPSNSLAGTISRPSSSASAELLTLCLTTTLTICTECTGFAHSTALRSALAAERRLVFNTNIRLFTYTRERRWIGPNGALANALMATTMVLAFVSSSLAVQSDAGIVTVSSFPLLVAALCVLLQATVAAVSLIRTRILTWSSTALDTAAALVHHSQLMHVPSRSMCSVVHATEGQGKAHPMMPARRQPSAWQARRGVRVAVMALWVLVAGYTVWGGTIFWRVRTGSSWNDNGPFQWTFLASYDSDALAKSTGNNTLPSDANYSYNPPLLTFVNGSTDHLTTTFWVFFYLPLLLGQGWLTLALHLLEVVVNTIQDETIWRKAGEALGVKPQLTIVETTLASWPTMLLFAVKPVLHWLFNLIFILALVPSTETVNNQTVPIIGYSIEIGSLQIWNFTLALALLASIITRIALRHPKGPQPAAYGHIQTLANLVDEWPTGEDENERLWWGHKGRSKNVWSDAWYENQYRGANGSAGASANGSGSVYGDDREEWCDDDEVCRAGTSDRPLGKVEMDALYA